MPQTPIRFLRFSRSSRFFRVGKLPPEELDRLLGSLTASDPRLVLGARVGEDAAVIEMGDRYLVVKTDPITFATGKIGWYCVHINANDVAVLGAKPQWFLATLLLPARMLARSMAQAAGPTKNCPWNWL
ncbi:MAG: hypothetical protein HY647_07560 [Acidobacteria bacterium]|nr:hypothetical protein [Acidobacteriota bacterium]